MNSHSLWPHITDVVLANLIVFGSDYDADLGKPGVSKRSKDIIEERAPDWNHRLQSGVCRTRLRFVELCVGACCAHPRPEAAREYHRLVRARRPYHAMAFLSRKKAPVGPSSGRVASQTGVSAPF